MKKILITFFVMTTTVLCCNAQLLWKITGDNLKKPSYIFGTHHIAPMSVTDSITGFNKALSSVDKVYGEVTMTEINSPQSQKIMLTYAMAPNDSLLTTLLSKPQLDSLDKVLKRYMGPMASASQFSSVKPAMVSTLLSMMQSQSVFPTFNPSEQIDCEIQKRATAMGKEIGSFETIEDQCQALFVTSIQTQTEDLMNMVRHDDIAGDLALRLAKAYLSGDLDLMLSIMNDPATGGYDKWADRMINKRNANWLHIIYDVIPSKSIFIVVGAGHLPGEKGLINLLREDGFSVEPIE